MAGDENRFYVYLHTFSDGSIYVGKGSWSRAHHFGPARRGCHWLNAKNKYGKPAVSFPITDIPEDLSYFIERELIAHYRLAGSKLRNISDGGEGGASGMSGERSPNYGRVRSDILKDEHSKRMTGEGNPRYGKTLTCETKRRISKARIGNLTYRFTHEDGREFVGGRYDFQIKYEITTKAFFCKNPAGTVRGWRVAPSQ